jgi:hypothetical protein
MTAQNCVARDDAADSIERFAVEFLTDSRKPDSLASGQPWQAHDLIAQDAILCGEVLDLDPKLFIDFAPMPAALRKDASWARHPMVTATSAKKVAGWSRSTPSPPPTCGGCLICLHLSR